MEIKKTIGAIISIRPLLNHDDYETPHPAVIPALLMNTAIKS